MEYNLINSYKLLSMMQLNTNMNTFKIVFHNNSKQFYDKWKLVNYNIINFINSLSSDEKELFFNYWLISHKYNVNVIS